MKLSLNLKCDNCGKKISIRFYDFDRMKTALFNKGWVIISKNGASLFFCPNCSPTKEDYGNP